MPDNASGPEAEGTRRQAVGGYSGPTTATIESAEPASPLHHHSSHTGLRHVTVRATPGGGGDCLVSDVTDNDVNSRRLESLQVRS